MVKNPEIRAGGMARGPSAARRGGSSLARSRRIGPAVPRPIAHAPRGEPRCRRFLHRCRVIARTPPRMAAAEPRKAQPEAGPRAMGTHAIHRIMRAARPITAAHAQRSKGWRERELIEAQKSQCERRKHGATAENGGPMARIIPDGIARGAYHICHGLRRGGLIHAMRPMAG